MINLHHFRRRISHQINSNVIFLFSSQGKICLQWYRSSFILSSDLFSEGCLIAHRKKKITYFSMRNSGFIKIEICYRKIDFDEIVPMKNEKQWLFLLVAESVRHITGCS